MLETECKIPVPSLEPIAARLASLGALRQGVEWEDNQVYDAPDGSLAARGALLRLRRWRARGGGLFTVKVPPPPAPGGECPAGEGGAEGQGDSPPLAFKVRVEHETRVEDPDAMDRALRALGYAVSGHYRKEREEWQWDGTHIALDRLPELGCFVEIEGAPSAILSVLAALGLDPGRHIPENYLTLMQRAKS